MTYEITYIYKTGNGGRGITTTYADTRAKTERGINTAAARAIKEDAAACGVEFAQLVDVCEFKKVIRYVHS